jgi:outer membrane immunogenic protein
MKTILPAATVCVVLACAISPALRAADVPPTMPPPRSTALVPFFSWNGAYVGINAGYGMGRSKWTDNVTGVSTGTFNVSGGTVGGTLGYNLVFSATVLGVETDLNWSGLKGSTAVNCGTICNTSNDWFGTTRGRIGTAFDRFLPYFTGGVAYGSVKISNNLGGSASITKVGWTLGGGLEYAFLHNWTMKAEYLYADFGKATCDAACSGGDPFDVRFNTHVLRGGLNYKF